MKSLARGIVFLGSTLLTLAVLAGDAKAQVANVTVKAERNGGQAVVLVAVNAKFKTPTGDIASGDHAFADLKVSKGETVQPDAVTKSGFRYSIEVQWKDDDTIEARAEIRSLYGTAKGVGSTKV